MAKVKVYMGLPSTGNRRDSQIYALRRMQERHKDEIEFIYPELCVHRILHDYARNQVVEEFLESEADILWFLDSDVTPPADAMQFLLETQDKWKAAGITYPIWLNDQVIYTTYKRHPSKPNLTYSDSRPTGGREFVAGLATGCLFLKRELFENMQKPYFEFRFDPESREMIEGEDLGFARKLHEQGIEFYTDHGLVCKHFKVVDLVDCTNYAIEYANAKVLSYDKQIRHQVSAIASQNQALRQRVEFLEREREAVQKQSASGLILP